MNEHHLGEVVAVQGAIVDVRFRGVLPPLYTLLLTQGEEPMAIEVQSQLDEHHVRGIALTPTQGLSRGTLVKNTNGPLKVPVGRNVLSRMFDVFGNPIDQKGPMTDVILRSVHQTPRH